MLEVVIDTNVLIAANGINTHASDECQLKCIDEIQKIVGVKSKVAVVLDAGGEILSEYNSHMSHKGAPGVGDMLFKYLHNNKYVQKKVMLVDINPVGDDKKGYSELPDNKMDRSDRKFLACAIVAGAKIINATDTDWHEHKEEIQGMGVDVEQLCEEHGCKLKDKN